MPRLTMQLPTAAFERSPDARHRHGFRAFRLALQLGACVLGARALLAQGPSEPPGPAAPASVMTPALRSAVVDSVAVQLERFYAVEDTAHLIANRLRGRLRAGAYDALTTPTLFAEAVSRDMRSINGDKHLNITVAVPGTPVLPAGLTELPPRRASGPETPPQRLVEVSRHNNYSLGRVEILPGNVGYFQVNGFNALEEAQDAIVDALRYLQYTDAMIIDMREHGGGSGELSNFLLSHFTKPDTVEDLVVTWRAAPPEWRVEHRYTLATVPGPRRPAVPLFLLTSRGTISAGEDFVFVLKNLGRAVVVGETTAGGGRNNPRFDTGLGFVSSISASTVRDPRTGAEWEGVGIKPDIAVAPRSALTAAHLAALDTLAKHLPARQREYALTREYVAAAAKPVAVPVARLRAVAGVYGGQRTIFEEGGKLYLRRTPDRYGLEMTPLSSSTYAITRLERVTFEGSGASRRIKYLSPTGEELTLPRTGDVPPSPPEHE